MSERGAELDQVMNAVADTALPPVADIPTEKNPVKLLLGEGQELREYIAAATHLEPIPAPNESRGTDYGNELETTLAEAVAWAERAGHLIRRVELERMMTPPEMQALLDGFKREQGLPPGTSRGLPH